MLSQPLLKQLLAPLPMHSVSHPCGPPRHAAASGWQRSLAIFSGLWQPLLLVNIPKKLLWKMRPQIILKQFHARNFKVFAFVSKSRTMDSPSIV
ncbi:MAG: hypothetical protein OIF54_17275, partial [Cohaesibacter sp.]|nr:hypothetical protein [Cohaesibacter sp.]